MVCSNGNYYDVDLTDGMKLDWKSLLRNMDHTLANTIVGESGIQHMRFRILLNRIDSNYRNANSATPWRHVFEFIRCDGSAIHIHYHKNGSHDALKEINLQDYPDYPRNVSYQQRRRFQTIQIIQTISSGDSHPAGTAGCCSVVDASFPR